MLSKCLRPALAALLVSTPSLTLASELGVDSDGLFHDANANGRKDVGEPSIGPKAVSVSAPQRAYYPEDFQEGSSTSGIQEAIDFAERGSNGTGVVLLADRTYSIDPGIVIRIERAIVRGAGLDSLIRSTEPYPFLPLVMISGSGSLEMVNINRPSQRTLTPIVEVSNDDPDSPPARFLLDGVGIFSRSQGATAVGLTIRSGIAGTVRNSVFRNLGVAIHVVRTSGHALANANRIVGNRIVQVDTGVLISGVDVCRLINIRDNVIENFEVAIWNRDPSACAANVTGNWLEAVLPSSGKVGILSEGASIRSMGNRFVRTEKSIWVRSGDRQHFSKGDELRSRVIFDNPQPGGSFVIEQPMEDPGGHRNTVRPMYTPNR
jgi:hypothetical protein